MLPLYQLALNGMLRSPAGTSALTVTVANLTPISINVYWLSYAGTKTAVGAIEPNGRKTGLTTSDGQYYLITAAATGGFMGVITIRAGLLTYSVDATLLPQPYDIGAVPAPRKLCLIPPDSPRVVVAFGKLTGTPQKQGDPIGTSITREQYWKRQSDSYCLAPGETRTVSVTTTTGKETTSSEDLVLSASLGLDASASWGAASASMSASLSGSSTTTQQVTVTEQAISFISARVENLYTQPAMFLRWQLVDVVTIFDANNKPLSSVLTAESPSMIGGPYNVHTNYPLFTLINCGGTAAGSFGTDADYSGGLAASTTESVNTSLVKPPAPQAVYQTMRYGSGPNGKAANNSITYTIPNLTSGAAYKVTLHFAEIGGPLKPGSRVFNVLIDTKVVLANFDVVAEARKEAGLQDGGTFTAIAKTFEVRAPDAGQITIEFDTATSSGLPPIINGIMVEPPSIPLPALPSLGPAARRKLAGHDFVLTVSPSSMYLDDDHTTGAIVATLTENGQPAAGKPVQAQSQNSSYATVSPATSTTDSTGKASFTVVSGNEGATTITVESEDQSAAVTLTVGD